MTRMIPPVISSTTQSRAERKMFEIIRDAPHSDRWVCVHSLDLAHHETKRRAEADFVLITHHGVFVLEVKGGGIKRTRGAWYSVGRDDKTRQLAESPFAQAAGAMFALQKRIQERFSGKAPAKALFGYGVLFPDTTFDLDGPESDRRLVYDSRDRERGFDAYVHRLAEFAREAESRDKRPMLKPDAIDELADFLRGDFAFLPASEIIIKDIRQQLDQLTKEQRSVLDSLVDSECVLVEGGAGTGKTVLAIEAAQRLAAGGKRVLFLCFNRLLAARLEARMAGKSYGGELRVRNLHRHFFEVIEGSEGEAEFQASRERGEQDAYDRLLPEYAGLLASEWRDEERFDVLVIDEAQDILTNVNLEALEQMLRGGLEQGRWCVFMDGGEQAKVYGRLEEAAYERLRGLGIREHLSLNCRNTRQVAEQTALVAGCKRPVSARVDGLPVEFRTYTGRGGWLEELGRVVDKLRADGVPAGRISVLLVKRPKPEEEKRLEKLGLRRLEEKDVSQLGTDALSDITWSVVSGFKGLENDVVILCGLTDIEREWHRGVAYVGMSRARVGLHVIIHADCESERKARESEWKTQRNSDFEMVL